MNNAKFKVAFNGKVRLKAYKPSRLLYRSLKITKRARNLDFKLSFSILIYKFYSRIEDDRGQKYGWVSSTLALELIICISMLLLSNSCAH